MGKTLNNITSPSEYEQDTGTLETTYPLARISLRVYNNAVYRQVLVGLSPNPSEAQWQDELFVPPGQETIRRRFLFGVRVRSAVPTEAAQVTVEAVSKTEEAAQKVRPG